MISVCSNPAADIPLCGGQPVQVIDLSMDDDNDDDGAVLLDWERYSARRRVRCCGCDWTTLATWLPCCSAMQPEWWFRYSKAQWKVLLRTSLIFQIEGIERIVDQDTGLGKGGVMGLYLIEVEQS